MDKGSSSSCPVMSQQVKINGISGFIKKNLPRPVTTDVQCVFSLFLLFIIGKDILLGKSDLVTLKCKERWQNHLTFEYGVSLALGLDLKFLPISDNSSKFKQPTQPGSTSRGSGRYWNTGNGSSSSSGNPHHRKTGAKERSDLVLNWRNAGPDQNNDWRNHEPPSRPDKKNSWRDEPGRGSDKTRGMQM